MHGARDEPQEHKSTGASLSDMIESSKTPHLRVVYLPVGRKGIPTGRPAKVLFWAWRIRLGGFVGRIRPVFSPRTTWCFGGFVVAVQERVCGRGDCAAALEDGK